MSPYGTSGGVRQEDWSVTGGFLRMSVNDAYPVGTDETIGIRGVMVEVPPLSAGDITIITKVTMEGGMNSTVYAGLILSNSMASTGSAQLTSEFALSSSGSYMGGLQKWSDWYLKGTYNPNFVSNVPYANATTTVYIRAVRFQGSWYMRHGSDGQNWISGISFPDSEAGVPVGKYVGLLFRFAYRGKANTIKYDWVRMWSGNVTDSNAVYTTSAAAPPVVQSSQVTYRTSGAASPGQFAPNVSGFSSKEYAVSSASVAAPSSVGLGETSDTGGITMDFREFNASTGTGTIFGTVRVWFRMIMTGVIWISFLFWVFRTLTVKINA